jgi:hypothetical protein
MSNKLSNKLIVTVAGLGLAAACLHGAAAGTLDEFRKIAAEGAVTHRLEIDNDSLLMQRDDGFYSSGLGYTQHYTLRQADAARTVGWRIGQQLYTASDIKLAPDRIGRLDHPYAGWLYAGVFSATARADGSAYRYGIDIGCLGPCAGGRWTQTNLHRLLNQPLPRGWSTQLGNEPGLVLYGEVAPRRWTPASWIDLTPVLHGRIGNIFTDAGAGLTLRAGRLAALPEQPTLHAFARLDARAVAYNATLQGGMFSGGGQRTVNPKRLVGEAEAGLAWQASQFGVTLSILRRSSEIDGLSNAAGAQNFARILLTYTP